MNRVKKIERDIGRSRCQRQLDLTKQWLVASKASKMVTEGQYAELDSKITNKRNLLDEKKNAGVIVAQEEDSFPIGLLFFVVFVGMLLWLS